MRITFFISLLLILASCNNHSSVNAAGTGINSKNLDPFLTCFYSYLDTAGYLQPVLQYEKGLIQNGLLKSVSQSDYEQYFKTYVGPKAELEKRICPGSLTQLFREFFVTDCCAFLKENSNAGTNGKKLTEEQAILKWLANGEGANGQEETINEVVIGENRLNTREKRLFYLILFLPL
jgi:hypothetical protein